MDALPPPQVTTALERLYVPAARQIEADALVEGVRIGPADVCRHHESSAPPSSGRVGRRVDEATSDPESPRALGDYESGDERDVGVVVQPRESVEREDAQRQRIRPLLGNVDRISSREHADHARVDPVRLGRIAKLAEERG